MKPTTCQSCGYDLTGLALRCPECGKEIINDELTPAPALAIAILRVLLCVWILSAVGIAGLLMFPSAGDLAVTLTLSTTLIGVCFLIVGFWLEGHRPRWVSLACYGLGAVSIAACVWLPAIGT